MKSVMAYLARHFSPLLIDNPRPNLAQMNAMCDEVEAKFGKGHGFDELVVNYTALARGVADSLTARGVGPAPVASEPRFERQLHAALVGAFDREAFERLVYFALGISLEDVAAPSDLRQTVFACLKWASKAGRLGELATAAANERPTSAALRTLSEEYTSPELADSPTPE